jgi:Sec-independent protein translocase protein TatA
MRKYSLTIGDLIMAKEEQILLENIFDAACIIEESFLGKTARKVGRAVQGARDYAKSRINDAANFVADKTKTTIADRIEKGMRPVKDFISDKAYDLKSKMSQLRDNLNDQARAVGKHVNANKTAYGAGLLGLGAAGAGAYALRDKIGDAADDTGEAIHSLRNKITDIINAHHEA